MAYSKGSLVLSEATVADIPLLSATFPRAYHHEEYYKVMIPDTPVNDKWWQESHRNALRDPNTAFLKVVDQDNGEIVALARWILPSTDDGGTPPSSGDDRWPKLTDEMDLSLADPFFEFLGRGRSVIMGNRKHYFLELLQTVQEYKGRGAGTLLLKYGLDLADKDGLEVYLDASMDGFPLYSRYGFVVKGEEQMPGPFDYIGRYMVRPAKGTGQL